MAEERASANFILIVVMLCRLICCGYGQRNAFSGVATIVITLALLFNRPLIVNGQTFTKETYPDPRVDYSACGNSRPSWVCDPGNYLKTGKDALSALIDDFVQMPDAAGAAIMVAVVPKVSSSDGSATSSPEDLKEFSRYLQETAWREYSDNLLVIMVNIHPLSVWVHFNSSLMTQHCTCLLAYQTHQYLQSQDYNTLIDIYIRRFIGVILGQQGCPPGPEFRQRRIHISSLDPPAGLPGEEVNVTISGRNIHLARLVTVGTRPCQGVALNATQFTCTAQSVSAPEEINTPMPVYLWPFEGIPYDTGKRFIYTKPTLFTVRPLSTTISGGLRLTVQGSNLDLVRTAIMKTELIGRNTGRITTYRTNCTVKSPTLMLCPTPKLDLSTVCGLGGSRKRRDLSSYCTATGINTTFTGNRRRRFVRATNEDESKAIEGVDVLIQFELNGETSATIDNDTRPLRLNLYENPHLEPFEDEGRIKDFVSVWPVNDRTIEIKGTKLLPALRGHSFDLFVGSGMCELGAIFANRLICKPPIKNSQSDGRNQRVQVNIGNLKFDIGYLNYVDNALDYPPTRWGIVGGAAALLLILLVIVVCCCCKRSSKKK